MKKFLIISLLAACSMNFISANKSYASDAYVTPSFTTFDTELYLFADNKTSKKVKNGVFPFEGNYSSWELGKAGKSRSINAIANNNQGTSRLTTKSYVTLNNSKIKWYFEALKKTITFGTSKHQVITGCDFNGDGTTDPAIYSGKVIQYKLLNSGSTKKINLPKKGYTQIICADVTGNGESEVIAGKLVSKKFIFDVINKKSKVLHKNIKIGGTKQGTLVALDINYDGKDEIGVARKASSTSTRVIFANNLSNAASGVKTVSIPKVVTATNKVLNITPALFGGNLGFYYKTKDGFYNYNFNNDVNRKFSSIERVFGNMAASGLTLVKKSELINLSSSVGSGSVQCDVNRTRGNGFLWKGVGEAYGHVSVGILPIYNKATSCQVVASDGSNTIGMWVSSQSANPWNGVGRQHWRAKATCKSMKTPSVLRCQIGGKSHCWTISSPCARLE